ncbi:hypothetical protein RND71_036805 [Anisodus tanguticus]|uniref:Uncharacterized protein n=1 Tax=Anisodus tanguticus TaxID=243964 RepID=A0AAE1R2C5_9SOLA|nr:hypothetical protein RND71_036805 [Anisodus tanguticus]
MLLRGLDKDAKRDIKECGEGHSIKDDEKATEECREGHSSTIKVKQCREDADSKSKSENMIMTYHTPRCYQADRNKFSVAKSASFGGIWRRISTPDLDSRLRIKKPRAGLRWKIPKECMDFVGPP